jgi:hypothetical protein
MRKGAKRKKKSGVEIICPDDFAYRLEKKFARGRSVDEDDFEYGDDDSWSF